MPDVVTDTHALIWYLEDSPRLGSAAKNAFGACERGESIVYIPTISLVEIVYLQEKGRGAVATAAALTGQAGSGRIVCIVSGGNIDAGHLPAVLAGRVPTVCAAPGSPARSRLDLTDLERTAGSPCQVRSSGKSLARTPLFWYNIYHRQDPQERGGER